MRVIVLDGGVVGRHGLVVAERNREVATEASFGDAGMIAPGHSSVGPRPLALPAARRRFTDAAPTKLGSSR